jgi:4-hydroxysphinganine ceramide fatty acyl 2-hydroxylase
MFQSDVLEVLTHVHPAVPHLIFIPVIGYMIYLSLGMALASALFLFLSGIAFWTVTEYSLHRFVFHFEPRNAWQGRLHFIIHGVHHDYPNDSRRLVMPPVVSIPLSVLFYGFFTLMLGSHYASPFFGGFIFGYLAYDTTHYAIHHFSLREKVGLYLKKHHLRHHFAEPDENFGISSPLWDIVFGTLQQRRQGEREAGSPSLSCFAGVSYI